MTKYTVLIAGLFLVISSCGNIGDKPSGNSVYVDPFIGTAGDHGQTDPSANTPFGMIKPGPDTDPGGHAGYDFNALKIKGFSQTRMSGTGCRGTGGNLRILPFVGKYVETVIMDKNTEIAAPGYYRIKLSNGVDTEISAGRTSAMYRFSYPESSNSGLSVDFTSSFEKFWEEHHDFAGKAGAWGSVTSGCTCNIGRYKFYYYFEIDKTPEKAEENGGKLFLGFHTEKNEKIVFKIGLSTVSPEAARLNLLEECGDKTFNQLVEESSAGWNSLLSRVNIETDDDSLKTLFYTNLYHACQTPYNIIDHNGDYRGSDGRVYNLNGKPYYFGWSIWDTFRTKFPLFSLLYPDDYKAMISSIMELYKQGKSDWANDNEPFLHTRTEHSVVVLLDALQKGLLEGPLAPVLPCLLEEAEKMPMNTPDKILESSYDFWALSKIAGKIGKEGVEKQYKERAQEYRDVWISKFLVMDENSDIMHMDGLYEGTLWQYRWFVPHDMDWVAAAIGGRVEAIAELDYFFNNNLFNLGNEPDIHVPFLYYEFGKPWKSQKLVREILLEPTVNHYGTHEKWETPYTGKVFRNHPEGFLYEMDDDCGTMSSWFVLSSIGLYPRCVGSSEFWILPPVFDSVTLNPEGGKQFVIKSLKNSDLDIYIQKVFLNNSMYVKSYLNYQDIIKGGELILELGNVPNEKWGSLDTTKVFVK